MFIYDAREGGSNPTHISETINLRILKSAESLKATEATSSGTNWARNNCGFRLSRLRKRSAELHEAVFACAVSSPAVCIGRTKYVRISEVVVHPLVARARL